MEISGLKVLIVIFEQLFPLSGGGTPRISNIVKSFTKDNHKVYVAAAIGKKKEKAMEKLNCIDLLPLLNVSRISSKKFVKYLYAYPVNILKTVNYAKKVKPDLIICHNSIAGFAGLMSKNFRTYTILDLTDLLFEYLEDYKGKEWIKLVQILGRWIERKVILKSDRIVTISESMKKILKDYGVDTRKVDVIYDGVDTQVFKPFKEKKLRKKYGENAKNIVIFQGVIDPQDAPQILVDAAKIVLKKHPDTIFWIVGDGTAVPQLKKRISAYKLEDKFYFSGWMIQKEVVKYISNSDIGLVILPDILSARGRVTLKEFEYWACRIPAIVPCLPALKEVVQENETGLFYQPGNSESLAEKINLLIEDKELREKMGENGMRIVKERFEWQKLTDEFVKRCENYINERKIIL